MLNPYILNWAEFLYGREVWTQVNPSTPRPENQGLLRVDPEPRFLTPSLKTGLGAAERVKKTSRKEKIDEEELPCAYAATVTTTTYEILYECKDCGEKWTETKEETKFN